MTGSIIQYVDVEAQTEWYHAMQTPTLHAEILDLQRERYQAVRHHLTFPQRFPLEPSVLRQEHQGKKHLRNKVGTQTANQRCKQNKDCFSVATTKHGQKGFARAHTCTLLIEPVCTACLIRQRIFVCHMPIRTIDVAHTHLSMLQAPRRFSSSSLMAFLIFLIQNGSTPDRCVQYLRAT